MLSIIAASTLPTLPQAEGSDFGSSLTEGNGASGGFAALLAQLGKTPTDSLPSEIRNLLASPQSESKPLDFLKASTRFQESATSAEASALTIAEAAEGQARLIQGERPTARDLPESKPSIQNLSATRSLSPEPAPQPGTTPSGKVAQEVISTDPLPTKAPETRPHLVPPETLQAKPLTVSDTASSVEVSHEAPPEQVQETKAMTPLESQSQIMELLLPQAPKLPVQDQKLQVQDQRPGREPKTEERNEKPSISTLHSHPADHRVPNEASPQLARPIAPASTDTKPSAWSVQALPTNENQAKLTGDEKPTDGQDTAVAAPPTLENPYAGLQAAALLQAPPAPRPFTKETASRNTDYPNALPLSSNAQPSGGFNTASERPAIGNDITPPRLELDAPESAIIAATEHKPETSTPTTFATALSNAGQATAQTESSPHQSQIPTHVRDPNWPAALGERVTWLAKQDIQSAEIHLNPPQLGPVHISISLSGDQATASFTVANVEVRQAIESSLPQLRDMLASSGIQLGDANVGAQSQQQAREQASQFSNGQRSRGEDAILRAPGNNEPSATVVPLNRGRGMVDLFA